MPQNSKEVFISYAWGGSSEDFVNRLDLAFQKKGIVIIRDKRDLGYKGGIKEFMEKIGRGKCVITVISDKYLKSPNCMFELLQVAKNGEFHDRIFPIVLADAQIYETVKLLEYVKHWEDKKRELNEAIRGVGVEYLGDSQDKIEQYTEIRNTIAKLMGILSNMNTLTQDLHNQSDFEAIFNLVQCKLTESGTQSWVYEKDLKGQNGHTGRVNSIVFNPSNSNVIFSASADTKIKKWNINSGNVEKTYSKHSTEVRVIAVTSDAETLVSSSKRGTIRIWDINTGNVKYSSPPNAHFEGINALALSSDGRILVSGASDNKIKVWEARGALRNNPDLDFETPTHEILIHKNGVRSLAVDWDKRILISGSSDSRIKITDLGTEKRLNKLTEHTNRVNSLVIDRNGQMLVSASADASIRIWNINTGERDGDPLLGHDGAVLTIAISPDNRTLASGGVDQKIRIWDLIDRKTLFILSGHTSEVRTLAFSPDGEKLASGSSDSIIKIWKLSED